ncbi:PilW family protein [Pseudomonas sp. SCB32]|uniref:PilW family protein n=1 Tax=Pseudomonas sp. SCB32 TaxID=2653853 RepID=UPI0012642AD5|nr:PilW family protein [Pseudomonas sp. SCB32]
MRRLVQQRGFTLVEMMVAVTIGLLIMVGVLSLYLNLRRTNDDMANTNALIENGRFAVQLMQEDLSHAGFWNGYIPQFDDLTWSDVPTDVPAALPPVCGDFSTWTAADKTAVLGVAVQAFSAVPAGCSGIVTNLATNSDVLVVRHVATCSPGVGNCEASTAGKVYFQVSSCSTEPASSYVFGTGGFVLHQRDCLALAESRKYVTDIYYVRTYAVTPGDGIPTLMRSQFDSSGGATPVTGQQAAVPLIEGIEAFRVELGIDNISKTGGAVRYDQAIIWTDPTNQTSPTNRGDGTADGSFIHCGAGSCALADLMNVVEAKLYVLVRSRSVAPGYTSDKTYALGGATLGPFTDSYKRHLFTSSAALVNVSRRRQTP